MVVPPLAATVLARDKLHRSRLAEGTLVWTARGQRPVESVTIGDRVLTQDPHTGALAYAQVVDTGPAATDDLLQLSFEGGGTLSITPMERIWKAGRGWVAAHALKPGDEVRRLEGKARLAGVKRLDPRPTFNFVLLEASSILAGEPALLVHDNSIVRPPSRPFDDVPDLTTKPSRPPS
jgi:hypothetical protein